MFLSWLFTVFPKEMLAGWRLVRSDLVLWIALFSLGALMTLSIEPTGERGQDAARILSLWVVSLFLGFLAVMLFDARAAKRELDWKEVFSRLAAKGGPYVLYGMLTSLLWMGPGLLVAAGVFTAFGDSPVRYAALFLGPLIMTTLLARFAFVPFLVVLDDREHWLNVRGTGEAGFSAALPWPLRASDQLGAPSRWNIAPYAFLHVAAVLGWLRGLLTAALPEAAYMPALVGEQLFVLTAQAVLFAYFLRARSRHPALASDDPV